MLILFCEKHIADRPGVCQLRADEVSVSEVETFAFSDATSTSEFMTICLLRSEVPFLLLCALVANAESENQSRNRGLRQGNDVVIYAVHTSI